MISFIISVFLVVYYVKTNTVFSLSDKDAFITGTDFMCDGDATASYYYDPLRPWFFNNLITDYRKVVGIFYICTKLIIL